MSCRKTVFISYFLMHLSTEFCSYLWDSLKQRQSNLISFYNLVKHQTSLGYSSFFGGSAERVRLTWAQLFHLLVKSP